MEIVGIVLAGGSGKRLQPSTTVINKHLIPVYDKPMIYYPFATLMLLGIKNIIIVTSPEYIESYKKLFGNGSHFGVKIKYIVQEKPNGIPEVFLLCKNEIKNKKICLILGDNIFYGSDLKTILTKNNINNGAEIFTYQVDDPSRYGIVEFSKQTTEINIIEKPKSSKSKNAITGIYYFDDSILDKINNINFSERGELEITAVLNLYLNEKKIKVNTLSRGIAWFDAGTIDSLYDATSFVKSIEKRQGLKIFCPEEIAWRNGWISDNQLNQLASQYDKNSYGSYLIKLLD